MADETEVKMPWESKTEIVAFIGLVSGLLVSFGVAGAALTAEQVAGLGTLMFLLVMIARQYGGGFIVWSQGAKEEKIVELAVAAEVKAEKLEAAK